MHDLTEDSELRALAHDLHALRARIVAAEAHHAGLVERCPPRARPSARNLLHYLALRSIDVRPLQERLARAGLSSLGRCEAHVLASLDAVLAILARALGAPGDADLAAPGGVVTFAEGERLRDAATGALLGPTPAGRRVRVMVTLGEDAAEDADVARALVASGTDLVRINCAHDDANAWARMIAHVRAASAALGRSCLVAMDMEGPKVRTRRLGEPVELRVGDRLRLVGADGDDDARDGARVAISIPSILEDVRPHEAVWFDDGKIGGVVERVEAGVAVVRVTHARGGRAALATDKGINFPDSALRVPGFTAKDADDLAFIARHADAVALSFAQHRADVHAVAERLEREGGARLGLILKIETRLGFEALPRLLLDALGTRPLGVMIARGDLALEVGYERLAEVQEEILWVCEAAHVPVIWATQVLERMAKDGVPTRAEVTDAAMSERAECVMLNKGKHVVDAVKALDDILRRMETHQQKKRPTMRPLRLSRWLAET
jgi:pyruvate kinase